MAKIVRLPGTVNGGITPDEKRRLDEHSRVWIGRIMRTETCDRAELTRSIEDLYRVSGLKRPRVVIVPSPLVMAYAYGAAASIWYQRRTATHTAVHTATRAAVDAAVHTATRAAVDAAVHTATRTATHTAVHTATRAAVDAATRAAVDAATRAAVDTATRAAVDAAVHTATRAAVAESAAVACRRIGGDLGLACAAQWSRVYQGGAYWGAYECYLSSFRDVLGLKLPVHTKYAIWERAAINGTFRIMHEEFCIVSDFPELLKVDDQHRPHCADGPSHRWRDGWELYYWHGVRVPDEWIRDKKLDAKTALTWTNIEQRRVACEIVGWVKILDKMNAKRIDRHPDPQVGELVECEIPDSGAERFLRVLCGTGREFAICVPKTVRTAMEAQAWTWGLDLSEFSKPEVRT